MSIDLSGSKYFYLNIVEKLPKIKENQTLYKCVCSCGKEVIIIGRGTKLSKKSCGCHLTYNRWEKGSRKPDRDKYSTLRARYKRDAKDRGFSFELTNEEFESLLINNCYYCGSKQQSKQSYNFSDIVQYTGIDRVDNSKGYHVDNCVSCCKECNILKKAVSKNIIEKAYKFLFGDNNE